MALFFSATRRARNERLDRLGDAFPTLTDEQRQWLLDRSRARSTTPDEVIVREGDPADAAYVIVNGKFEVDAHDDPIRMLGAGRCFGEIGVLRDEPRHASVVCRTDGELIVIPADVLGTLTDAAPGFDVQLERIADERLAQLARHSD